MFSLNQDLTTLHETARPVEGAFGTYVGTAQFFEHYSAKVMLQDAVYKHSNKGKTTSYTFKKGYIMLKPLVDQFVLDNPTAKCKDISKFKRDQKPAQTENSPVVPIITVKGIPEIKGTYFHPSIVSQVLAWVSEDLKKKIFAVFENATIEQNQWLANQYTARQ